MYTLGRIAFFVAQKCPLFPGSLLYVLYVLYLTRQPTEHPLFARQPTEHPLSPGSLLYVLYVLYTLYALQNVVYVLYKAYLVHVEMLCV